MSVFQLGDGSTPYGSRAPVEPDEELLDSEGYLEDFGQALGLLGDLDTATLAQLLLDDTGLDLPQKTGIQAVITPSELPLSNATAPRLPSSPSFPLDAAAPTQLTALESAAARQLTPVLATEPSPLSIGGPYWGGELAWRRTVKISQKRKASEDGANGANDEEDEEDEEDETERSRKRRAAWRKYNESALERRLNGDG